MTCYVFLFIGIGLTSTHAVRVNMQGSLSLGKEVMDTITDYLRRSYDVNGRRALNQNDVITDTTDTIALIVNSAFLCRDLDLCAGDLTKFVNEYVILLARTVENLFKGLLEGKLQKTLDNEIPKGVIFEEELRALLRDLRKFLNLANRKAEDDGEAFVWLDLFKKINAKFQEKASVFATARLEGNDKEIAEVNQKISQKLIIDTDLVELGFTDRLCTDYNICIKSYEVTRALKTILERLKALPDEQTKEFIRYFHETLSDSGFYYKISEVTANEFQTILNDMAYADNIHTKNVLAAVEKTVDERLKSIELNQRTSNVTGRDVMLVHVILSDMDHFYSKFGADPFHKFMSKFFEWVRVGGRFSSSIRQVMKDIASTLSLESDELVSKLVNEVRVFLEIVVDPDK